MNDKNRHNQYLAQLDREARNRKDAQQQYVAQLEREARDKYPVLIGGVFFIGIMAVIGIIPGLFFVLFLLSAVGSTIYEVITLQIYKKNRKIENEKFHNDQVALSNYNQAIALQPDYVDAYSKRGDIYFDLGNKEEAIADYTQAILLQPDYADAYRRRGYIYYSLGNKEAALSDYNQAIKLKPDNALAYYNRGHVYKDLGNKKKALSDFTKARDICQSQGQTEEYNHLRAQIKNLA